jgi:hypothetical protein
MEPAGQSYHQDQPRETATSNGVVPGRYGAGDHQQARETTTLDWVSDLYGMELGREGCHQAQEPREMTTSNLV